MVNDIYLYFIFGFDEDVKESGFDESWAPSKPIFRGVYIFSPTPFFFNHIFPPKYSKNSPLFPNFYP